VFAVPRTAEWAAGVAALAAPLPRRLAGRLAQVVVGIVIASGRRTAASWFRAAGVGDRFRSDSSFLGSVGGTVVERAAVLLGIVLDRIDPEGRLVFAIADTPTERCGPTLQGAGIPHDPTPGPAGSKFRSGHRWVVLSRIARPGHQGAIGRPILGPLDVRTKDVPKLPASASITFRTTSARATDLVGWLRTRVPADGQPPGVVVDGGYAQREFLTPAVRAGVGVGVAARLRKDAALDDRPPGPPPGPRRGRGRPPLAGTNRLSLAQRAGPPRGWQTVAVRTTTGAVVVKRSKTFLAPGRPAGGVGRVVILTESDGSWRASLCTAPAAGIAAIVQTIRDRGAIEPNFHDLKEVEGIEPVQWRRLGSNVGALHLSLWVPTLIAVGAWGRPGESLSDRSDRPWDDADRRPSHADRRRAVQRTMLEEEFQRVSVPGPWLQKIRHLLDGVVRLVAGPRSVLGKCRIIHSRPRSVVLKDGKHPFGERPSARQRATVRHRSRKRPGNPPLGCGIGPRAP
jgi:hypothetical protein